VFVKQVSFFSTSSRFHISLSFSLSISWLASTHLVCMSSGMNQWILFLENVKKGREFHFSRPMRQLGMHSVLKYEYQDWNLGYALSLVLIKINVEEPLCSMTRSCHPGDRTLVGRLHKMCISSHFCSSPFRASASVLLMGWLLFVIQFNVCPNNMFVWVRKLPGKT
jgi:hypothetical protein